MPLAPRLTGPGRNGIYGIEMGVASLSCNRPTTVAVCRIMAVSRSPSIVAALLAGALLAGCAADVAQHGNLPDPSQIAAIKPGQTTKAQVAKLLGSPSSVGVFDGEAWYYISRKTSRVAFFDPDVLNQQVYVISFNHDGVVSKIAHKTLKDGETISPVARATPAPGRHLSFLEQILGNLGRFNNSSGGSLPGPVGSNNPTD